jgi:hypothetical protein
VITRDKQPITFRVAEPALVLDSSDQQLYTLGVPPKLGVARQI